MPLPGFSIFFKRQYFFQKIIPLKPDFAPQRTMAQEVPHLRDKIMNLFF